MLRFPSRPAASLFLAALDLAILSQPLAAQQPGISQPSGDYGAGGHRVQQTSQATAQVTDTIYDPQGNIRQKETDTYATINGTKYLAERQYYNFDTRLHLTLGADYKYDLNHDLTFTDFTRYGMHGERIGEEVVEYNPNGYQTKDWSPGTHSWSSDTITYKLPASGTGAAPSAAPVDAAIDVILPRSYAPGETVSGSLWPASYGDAFNGVPGLAVTKFSLPLHHLLDGSPAFSGLEIGVKDNGYFPVGANGRFSLYLPYNLNGPLTLQARDPDAFASGAPGPAPIDIGAPVLAPAPTSGLIPEKFFGQWRYFAAQHLLNLWDDCEELEEEYRDAYNAPDAAAHLDEIADLGDDLDDCYDEIDDVEYDLGPTFVERLARGEYQVAIGDSKYLSTLPNPTDDDKAYLNDLVHWTKFVDEESNLTNFLIDEDHGLGNSLGATTPYWTSPVLNQGKLGALRGFYNYDPLDTHIHIDNFDVTPMAATPYESYFMPPDSLTAGMHNYIVDSPGIGETILPVFYMTLVMSADQLALHKGQHTTYHVTLNGLNGLPGGAWNSSFYPTDLAGPQELSSAQKAAGSSRTGFITLDITNQSPGTISMTNVFSRLDASFFAPSGSYTVNGGLGAIKDGSFSILGVARAFLNPELGLGLPAGAGSATSTPSTQIPYSFNWMPNLSYSYDPSWIGKSPLLNNCTDTGAAPSAASTPRCMGSTDESIYTKAIGNQPSVPAGNSQPGLSQLPAAHKSFQDAPRKADEAAKKMIAAQNAATAEFHAAVEKADPALQEKMKQGEEKLEKAKEEKEKLRSTQDAAPTAENAELLANAEVDEALAQSVYNAARQEVIDGFDAGTKKSYGEAVQNAEKAATIGWLPIKKSAPHSTLWRNFSRRPGSNRCGDQAPPFR